MDEQSNAVDERTNGFEIDVNQFYNERTKLCKICKHWYKIAS